MSSAAESTTAPATGTGDIRLVDRPALAIANALGCTEGQAYTLVIGIVVALVLAVLGVPPALRDGPAQSSTAFDRTLPPGVPGVPEADLPPATAAPDPGTGTAAPPLSSTPGFTGSFDAAPLPAGSTTSDSSTSAGSSAGTAPEPEPTPAAPTTPPPAPGSVSTFAAVSQGLPDGLLVAGERVFVATGTAPGRVLAFGTGGALSSTWAVGDSPLSGLAAVSDGSLVALQASGVILRVDATTGRHAALTQIPDVPACMVVRTSGCEPGVTDHVPSLRSAAIDRAGNLYVTDAGQGTIWQVKAGANEATIWHQALDYGTGAGPDGMTIGPDGTMYFSVGSALDAQQPTSGALYRIAVAPDGAAGARERIAGFGRSDAPAGVALGRSGKLYVALRGANAVVVIGTDGAETARYTTPADAPVPFDQPTAVAFNGSTLLVTNRASEDGATRAAVLAVGTDEPSG